MRLRCAWRCSLTKPYRREPCADTVSKVDGKTLHLGLMYRFVTGLGGYWAVRAIRPSHCVRPASLSNSEWAPHTHRR
jgi:hypothetical protein